MKKEWGKKTKKRELKQIPSSILMNQIWEHCLNRKNVKGEYLRDIHECLFLLCWKSGLRITEAVYFDFSLAYTEPENKGLFIVRGKRQKDRDVYLSPDVIKLLKERNWKSINELEDEEKKEALSHSLRISFFKYLKRIHKEINYMIPSRTELSPHTLRKCFATHNADNGMPLSILQKYLGHSRLSTTSLYVRGADKASLLKYKPIN